jgi:hypothetical protein
VRLIALCATAVIAQPSQTARVPVVVFPEGSPDSALAAIEVRLTGILERALARDSSVALLQRTAAWADSLRSGQLRVGSVRAARFGAFVSVTRTASGLLLGRLRFADLETSQGGGGRL